MMRKARHYPIITLLIMLLILTAACSNSKSQQQVEPAAGDGSEPVTLHFMHMTWVDAGQAVLDEAITEFTKQNPHITIEQSKATWGEGHSQVLTSLVTGTAADIIQTGGAWAPEFIGLDAFVPMEDLAPPEFLDQFTDSALSLLRKDGKTYGLPWEGVTWGMFYRTDLLDAKGLKPPTTWDELITVAKALTGNGQYGLVFPAKGWEAADYFLPFLWQAGCKVAEPTNDSWRSLFDTPECKAGLQMYYDLVHTHKVVPPNITGMDWEEAMKQFASGKAAIMFNGMWAVNALKSSHPDLAGKWATASMPSGPGGRATLGYPNTIHITRQSQHKKEAFAFLKFFYDNGYADRYAEAIGSLNWTKAFADRPFAQQPEFKPFVEMMSIAYSHPVASKWEEFRSMVFNPGIQDLILGKMQPEQAIQLFHSKFNEIHGYVEP